jgi:hypothetical protein
LWLGHTLEIAEGLEGDRPEPEVLDHPTRICGRAVKREQVVLEDLDSLELGIRNGLDLLRESAAQADSGNGGVHARRSDSVCGVHDP